MTIHVPRTRATTAYGLLKAVQKLILAEPKCYNQGLYVDYQDGDNELHEANMEYQISADQEFPACGTIGCVAGWVAILTRPGQKIEYFKARSIAVRALGPKLNTQELFGGQLPRSHYSRPGAIGYAQAGVQHIQRFIDANRATLKARKVKIK